MGLKDCRQGILRVVDHESIDAGIRALLKESTMSADI